MKIDHNGQRGDGLQVNVTNGYTLASRSAFSGYNSYANVTTDIAKYSSASRIYGIENNISGSSNISIYGIYNYITNSGSNIHYGTQNRLLGTGNGTKYGSYNFIPDTAGGTHFGVYSYVPKSSAYAGYFLGRVSVGTTTADNYILPSSRGTVGQIMSTDGSGNVSWTSPPTGDITGVIAGDGLTGGGVSGNVTVNVVAANGLTDTVNSIKLGGTLTEDTTITNGTFDTRFNLNSTGDFIIQDNGTGSFAVADNGQSTFGNDTFWRDGSISGTVLASLYDFSDDGVFDIYQGGSSINRLHGNGFSYINAGNLGIGTTTPDDKLSVAGTITAAFEAAESNKLSLGHDGSNAFINTIGSGRLDFKHEGVTGLTFTDLGNVGIGSTAISNAALNISKNSTGANPQLNLEESQADDGARINFTNSVESTNLWTLYARADNTSTSNYFNVYNTVGGNVLTIKGEGKIGINRTPITNALEVNGQASKTTSGSWIANSDRRLKKDIKQIKGKSALDKILKMKGVTYLWNDTKTGVERPTEIQYGFIAQELMQIFPEKVTKDGLGFYQTAYGDYDPIFVEAIKELNNKIELLETENTKLKQQLSRFEQLEERLSALENKTNLTATDLVVEN